MANGSFFDDIKSRIGSLSSRANSDDGYDEEYDEYDEYDEYEDDYDDSYDPYMDRNPVTTRDRGSRRGSDLPRLVSMDDARASAPGFSTASSSTRNRGASRDIVGRSSNIRSYGRTMVDSSLPSQMTAEGTAAAAASANRRAEGLNSLFGSASKSSSSDIIRNSMQLSMPGTRKLQVIKPTKYDDAEAVTNVLKSNDVAIISFGNTDRDLMKRILDFSFGAASALDANVECIANGVFAICRSVALDDNERADLKNMGII